MACVARKSREGIWGCGCPTCLELGAGFDRALEAGPVSARCAFSPERQAAYAAAGVSTDYHWRVYVGEVWVGLGTRAECEALAAELAADRTLAASVAADRVAA